MTSSAPSPAPPPLTGITVLDFTRVVAGPYLTMTLSDLGAEVIKIEAPGTGDDARLYYPPGRAGESFMFLALNRNKKSVALNITTPEGQDICRQLAQKADILVENFRSDVMQRQGLDYASLSALNPGLIYCSITGYGHDGPFRRVAGYDPVAQAEGGLMYLTGQPTVEPVRAGAATMDTFTGLHAGMAILSALHARHQTGTGQFIDLALFDTTLSVIGFMAQMGLCLGEDPPRTGNGAATMIPTGSYPCADGQLMLVCGNDRQFRKLCTEVLDEPDLADDPRFRTVRDRAIHRDDMEAIMRDRLSRQPRDYWVDRLRAAGVPGGSVRTPLEAIASPEATARNMMHDVSHPRAGTFQVVGSPIRLSANPVRTPDAAPLLGQHTEAVLSDMLGLDASAIAALQTKGVIELTSEET